MSQSNLGFSGLIAKKFLTSEITPLLALVGILLGLFAISVTPSEEEPQINVTFANVFIPFPGASAKEVAELVASPSEQILSEIDGVKNIYSSSYPGMAVVTVRFKVGEDRTASLVKLYNAIYSNLDWLPKNLGVGSPLIKPKGIDDVPIVTLTLWSENPDENSGQLKKVAHAIEAQLKRIKGTRNVYTVGSGDQILAVDIDPVRLAAYNISLDELKNALLLSNTKVKAGQLISDNMETSVKAGSYFQNIEDLRSLVIGLHNKRPVYLTDVAEITAESEKSSQYTWIGTGPAADKVGIHTEGEFPSVTLAVAKQPGTNAVAVAKQVIKRMDQLKGVYIPEDVNYTITRDYGETAEYKTKKLIGKLIFATAFVVLLVLLTMGWREAFIVGIAVSITLLITLFASWAWGFTLNRVSLFALIFSIGILVDDAIVVVENIHRHISMGKKNLLDCIPKAVDEVGGPTILATFTVIAALLPMAFVTGLMGPYMSPIPINASFGMIISLVIAFVVTPWLTYKVLKNHIAKHDHAHGDADDVDKSSLLYRTFHSTLKPFLAGKKGNAKRILLGVGIIVSIFASLGLVANHAVVLKMLPFDNKAEFQVVVDMPEGTPLEVTAQVLSELGDYLSKVEEVTDYQAYAGTAAPIGFNGLVRQYYLREGPNVGDLQVNLVDKDDRDRTSHEIALSVREPLQKIGRKYEANVKVVEVPPGPPVQAPLVAEVYGLDYDRQAEVATFVRDIFENTPDIVDIDDTLETVAPEISVQIDRQKATLLGVSQKAIVDAIQTVLNGVDVTYMHGDNIKYPVPVRLQFNEADKRDILALLQLSVRSQSGRLIPLSELVTIERGQIENAIHHKDLLPVTYVTGDMAGDLDSPLYGLMDIHEKLKDASYKDIGLIDQYFINQPENPYNYSIKWDGEWQITYETFRDMGIAYAIGMVLIYLLVVAQFKSYLTPLVIMAPIPLTVIGVMPGHALFDAQFTATSMIGMIALAGIIVRNSILLVDFINQQVEEGIPFEEAIIRSGAVRAKPIALTGLAAMLGALFIISDPIFSGLAISLIFGIFVSTLLTLVIIPILYYAFNYRKFESAE